MDYTQLTQDDVKHMLSTIGVDSIEALFSTVDATHRVQGDLNIPTGLSEPELLSDVRKLASRNTPTSEQISFLGAGIYDHFIPTLVDSLAMQSEFLTAYTPYQAEASQGVLQAFFEFQTMVCQLTGMEVSNASLYEFASSTAEAVLMAHSINSKPRVLVSEVLHPDTLAVLNTYCRELPLELVRIPAHNGVMDLQQLRSNIDDRTACVLIQHPNFLGLLESMPEITQITHDASALLIASVDPISCAMLKRPGDYGADIVVAEGQALGIPQAFGGPILGLLACKQDYLRKLPGRIVGKTTDRDGRQAFCLTLQTREQHIRREKATSNICTNQGLLAMRACVYMASMGQQGLSNVARQCFDKAQYAASRIASLKNYELAFDGPFFKEFVVRSTQQDVHKVMKHCAAEGILAGVPLDRWLPQLDDCFLIAVTEKRTKQEIGRLISVLENA